MSALLGVTTPRRKPGWRCAALRPQTSPWGSCHATTGVPDAAKEKDKDGGLALHLRPRARLAEIVGVCRRSPTPPRRTTSTATSLHYAAENKALEVVSALLQTPRHREKDNDGKLALHSAAATRPLGGRRCCRRSPTPGEDNSGNRAARVKNKEHGGRVGVAAGVPRRRQGRTTTVVLHPLISRKVCVLSKTQGVKAGRVGIICYGPDNDGDTR